MDKFTLKEYFRPILKVIYECEIDCVENSRKWIDCVKDCGEKWVSMDEKNGLTYSRSA